MREKPAPLEHHNAHGHSQASQLRTEFAILNVRPRASSPHSTTISAHHFHALKENKGCPQMDTPY